MQSGGQERDRHAYVVSEGAPHKRARTARHNLTATMAMDSELEPKVRPVITPEY